MKRCPVPFLQSDCFTTMLRLSLSALSLDHREAHESATVFLQNLLRTAHENSVSLNFFSEEKNIRSAQTANSVSLPSNAYGRRKLAHA